MNTGIIPGSVLSAKIMSDISYGEVQITGAVNQPGIYQIRSNETIFSLLKRTHQD